MYRAKWCSRIRWSVTPPLEDWIRGSTTPEKFHSSFLERSIWEKNLRKKMLSVRPWRIFEIPISDRPPHLQSWISEISCNSSYIILGTKIRLVLCTFALSRELFNLIFSVENSIENAQNNGVCFFLINREFFIFSSLSNTKIEFFFGK